MPAVKKTLDLGIGIGTVGLAVLWGLGESAELTCVEAQQMSYRVLTENIVENGLEDCVRAIHEDIRNLDLGERFPLITGSPPFFPIGTGSLPEDLQKAHARYELRDDVSDYARAARRHITEDGLFVFCFPFQQKSRCIKFPTTDGKSRGAGMTGMQCCSGWPDTLGDSGPDMGSIVVQWSVAA